MTNRKEDMQLEQYALEYENDPEFIAEGLSIKVVEEMLELLSQRNLNQSLLAQKMQVTRAHISRILNAPPNMTLLTIAKIAVALGVKPDVCLNVESRFSSIVLMPQSAVDYAFGLPSGQIGAMEIKMALPSIFNVSSCFPKVNIASASTVSNQPIEKIQASTEKDALVIA